MWPFFCVTCYQFYMVLLLMQNFFHLQYIIFAKTLLTRTKDLLSEGSITSIGGVRSLSWWVARLLFSQQKLLDGRSSFLFDLLQVFMRECLCNFGSLEEAKDYWGPNMLDEDALNILSMLHLEMGIMELYYGRVDASRWVLIICLLLTSMVCICKNDINVVVKQIMHYDWVIL